MMREEAEEGKRGSNKIPYFELLVIVLVHNVL
jgi:hypothetical protein